MKKLLLVPVLLLAACGVELKTENVDTDCEFSNELCSKGYRLPSYQELKDGALGDGTYWVKEEVAVEVKGDKTEKKEDLKSADIVCVKPVEK